MESVNFQVQKSEISRIMALSPERKQWFTGGKTLIRSDVPLQEILFCVEVSPFRRH